ncbi:exosortase C-terminal domain/associated protein EpsI [Sphingomonas sp. MMS24-JH45]
MLANGVRAFGTIYAAHLTSVEAATGFDHIVYGWVFFAAVMAGLMAAAWRWFSTAPPCARVRSGRALGAPASDAGGGGRRGARAGDGGRVPGVGAAWSARARPIPGPIALPAVPGWTRVPVETAVPWQPIYPAADHYLFGRYRNGRGQAVGHGARRLRRAARGARARRVRHRRSRGGLELDPRLADLPPIDGGAAVRIVAAAPGGRTVERVVATWYRVGGIVTGSATAVKIATVRDKLDGGAQTAVALHLSAEGPGRSRRSAPSARRRRRIARSMRSSTIAARWIGNFRSPRTDAERRRSVVSKGVVVRDGASTRSAPPHHERIAGLLIACAGSRGCSTPPWPGRWSRRGCGRWGTRWRIADRTVAANGPRPASASHTAACRSSTSPGSPQPMVDAAQRYAIVFNGEIYNYRDLRSELQARGRIFATDGDSEVLLHGYAEWGRRCSTG